MWVFLYLNLKALFYIFMRLYVVAVCGKTILFKHFAQKKADKTVFILVIVIGKPNNSNYFNLIKCMKNISFVSHWLSNIQMVAKVLRLHIAMHINCTASTVNTCKIILRILRPPEFILSLKIYVNGGTWNYDQQ